MTETALATALNSTYMAAELSLFAIIVGVALLLAGFGFAILAIGGALRNPETVLASSTSGARRRRPRLSRRTRLGMTSY